MSTGKEKCALAKSQAACYEPEVIFTALDIIPPRPWQLLNQLLEEVCNHSLGPIRLLPRVILTNEMSNNRTTTSPPSRMSLICCPFWHTIPSTYSFGWGRGNFRDLKHLPIPILIALTIQAENPMWKLFRFSSKSIIIILSGSLEKTTGWFYRPRAPTLAGFCPGL